MKNYKYFYLFFFFFSFNVHGQDIDASILSQVSPEEIEAAKAAFASKNFLDESSEELQVTNESLEINKSIEDANIISGKKYGYDFFSSTPTSLTAVGDLPLPNDYKISLRDQFTVILSGSKDAIFNLNVKLDGTILFPELGAISVVGLSLQEVKDKLSLLIEQSYIGVNIDISMQNLSAKKITIVGAVKTPGTYLINPFSTITGALAYSGGVSEIGSLRDIKLIRNNKVVLSFDLYDLLIRGDRSKDLTLEAGDTLLINAASQFIEITGSVKRPAIYEVLEGETLEDIIDFALGFNQIANKLNVSVSFLDLKQAGIVKKNVSSLNQSLTNALSVEVFEYVSQSTFDVQVFGAVQEPGFYDIKKYNNLESLISNLKFVNVYPWLGVLEQFDENKILKSTVLFNLNDPNTYKSIELLQNSKVYFTNINDKSFDDQSFDLTEITRNKIRDYELTINYKEQNFKLPVYGKYRVKSFIDLLGLDMTDVDDLVTYVSPLEDIVLKDSYKNMQFMSKKYQTVTFRSPVNSLIEVNVSGAVEFPGRYFLASDSTVEDLYQLIGSFKNQANTNAIILTRQSIKEKQIKAIKRAKDDLNKLILSMTKNEESMPDISVIQALSETIDSENLGRLAGNFAPKSEASSNTILFDGDSITVPMFSNTINVVGEVLNPLSFEYSENLNITSAITKSGGYKQYADKRRVYVIRANGTVEKASRNIFSRNINIKPGDTIVVPRRIITKNSGIQALAPLTQILSDIAFSAAALDNLTSN